MEFLKSKLKKGEKGKITTNRTSDNKVEADQIFREAMKYSVQAEEAFKKGNMKIASELCLQAIKLNKKLGKFRTPMPFERIAVILNKNGKTKEALNYINEYLEYEPQNQKFLKYREKFMLKLNEQGRK